MDTKQVINEIDKMSATFTKVSDEIWKYAELSVKEFKSAKLYVDVLKELGFEVEAPFDGIKTAFKGVYGSGKPVIGILAEYDALSGLSQKAGVAKRSEIVKGGSGHGCGHNMLGAGSLAAAYGIKKYLEGKKGKGTVIFYGCPGEEGGAAKAFMSRDGIFSELDIALTWHPSDSNEVVTGTCNSCIQTEYRFKGIASHAAGAPDSGRSALDAVQLMNLGVEFMREHMPDSARIHYAITDGGGASPNVVQPHARVLYMVRSKLAKDALALQERVDNIAKGAALMTGTKLTKVFIDGCSNTVPNKVLEEVLYKNFEKIGVPKHTKEEKEFAAKICKSYEIVSDRLPGSCTYESEEQMKKVEELSKNGSLPLNDFLMPYMHSNKQSMGSTDVGDVSWLVPTAQIHAVTFASNSPGHSWQNVSCGGSSIGHKGLLAAGKVLASTAIELYENPDIIKKAKAEFEKKTEGGYFCPVPKKAVLKAVE